MPEETKKRPKVDFTNVRAEAGHLIREHRKTLAVGLALMVMNRLAGLVIPATPKFLLDNVIAQSVNANAQRVPAPALLSGPRLNLDTTGAVRDALQVQVDAVMASLLAQMGLDQPVNAAVQSASPLVPLNARPAPSPASVVQPADVPDLSGEGAQPSPVREPQVSEPRRL